MGHEFIDWTLFGLFMYGLFALLPRRRRERWHRRSLMAPPPQYVPSPPPPAPGVGPPAAPPPPPVPPAPRLPADVEAQVERIRRKVELLLEHAGNLPAGSEDRYILQRTTTDYLPATLDAYLALPPASADLATAPDGRSALQVLKDQLSLLDHKLDEIGEDLQRQNLDRLLANGRFLEERFGGGNPSSGPQAASP